MFIDLISIHRIDAEASLLKKKLDQIVARSEAKGESHETASKETTVSTIEVNLVASVFVFLAL